jgi:RNA polymerase sigma factor (sigma-70 family)
VIMTTDAVGSQEADAAVIQLSWEEPAHFAAIFDRYFARIHLYLARRVGALAADDLAGEVFLAAFEQRRRYDVTRDEAAPWLYGIATNMVGTHHRQERRHYAALARARGGPAWQDDEALVTDRLAATAAGPALAAAIGRLSRGDRDVLLLVALADLGYKEVAQALDIPYGTVGSRLNRARRQLQESLGDLSPARY